MTGRSPQHMNKYRHSGQTNIFLEESMVSNLGWAGRLPILLIRSSHYFINRIGVI